MESDKSKLIEALKFHPRGAEKIGVGVREIKVIISDTCSFEIEALKCHCQWQALLSPVQCEETATRTRDLPDSTACTRPALLY